MAVSTVVQVVACDSGLVSSRTRSIAENRKLVRVILKKEKKLTLARAREAFASRAPSMVVPCH